MILRYLNIIFLINQEKYIKYQINPPSTPRTCPVINDDESLAKKRAAFATSSGVPTLPTGVSSHSSFIVYFERLAFIGVSISPGAMQFTVIPEGPNSFARAYVMPITAALDAE